MWSGASPTILPYLKGRDHLIAHYEPEGRTQKHAYGAGNSGDEL